MTMPAALTHPRASAFGLNPGSTARPGLLVIGDDPIASLCLSGPLAVSHQVERVSTFPDALARLKAHRRAIVVTDLQLPDGDGVELCAAAKRSHGPVVVLVCTDNVGRVPRALTAGCDSVLLKPFPPNLLHARLGRLTRDLLIRSAYPGAAVGTNQHWPDVGCPACGHSGATSFDHASLRRLWYACLNCEHVWIAKRHY